MVKSSLSDQTIEAFNIPEFKGTLEQQQAIKELYKQFTITTERARIIVNQFIKEMRKGLDHEGATVAMIPSFVTGRPTGNEKGKYLALDLGGTNLRVCEFELKGDGEFAVRQQKYIIAEEYKTDEMRQLCDFIADCVDNFITEHDPSGRNNGNEQLQLGFTFSFPVNQTAINRGTLMHWTKGFNCSGAINKDVVIMLQDSFLRKNIHVNIAALVNDTVGTLMANAYRYPETTMGIILGTGTNAAYYEKLENIKKWNGNEEVFEEMIVNMEWGAFDRERCVLPLTIYDNKLDRESINPHEQLFEKMMSGMYLGEIARNAILHLVDSRLLFEGESAYDLNRQWGFETSYMSIIIGDNTDDLEEVRHILEEVLQIPSTTLGDRQMVQSICLAIGRRSAYLATCGIAGVLSHTGKLEQDSLIAIDGSVYEFFPNFEHHMKQALGEIFGNDITKRVKFNLARDGSGFGAAMIAMMAHKVALAKNP
ncbi:hexokinase-domain-containing protein [Cokeromyces recurvatus]|uniref:hexokinase-domain-containing protein n=1 Tax=Cokeromyces recurvatus TaxID=90255 RepID=UPI002220D320|nr:hexokinase-domain-containing protein [Cokeromyces recurvatus]KAI7904321.1 hexokinase-domain-containing protein [Cokeromyces recurvatus]